MVRWRGCTGGESIDGSSPDESIRERVSCFVMTGLGASTIWQPGEGDGFQPGVQGVQFYGVVSPNSTGHPFTTLVTISDGHTHGRGANNESLFFPVLDARFGLLGPHQ
jgi:hypothetical protein